MEIWWGLGGVRQRWGLGWSVLEQGFDGSGSRFGGVKERERGGDGERETHETKSPIRLPYLGF